MRTGDIKHVYLSAEKALKPGAEGIVDCVKASYASNGVSFDDLVRKKKIAACALDNTSVINALFVRAFPATKVSLERPPSRGSTHDLICFSCPHVIAGEYGKDQRSHEKVEGHHRRLVPKSRVRVPRR